MTRSIAVCVLTFTTALSASGSLNPTQTIPLTGPLQGALPQLLDVNADGQLDLVTFEDGFWIARLNDHGRFQDEGGKLCLPPPPVLFTNRDFNGDGAAEWLTVTGQSVELHSCEDQIWSLPRHGRPRSMKVVDIDGNGIEELVVLASDPDKPWLELYRLGENPEFLLSLEVDHQADDLFIADLLGDHKPDVLILPSSSGVLQSVHWEADTLVKQNVARGHPMGSYTLADIDRNGAADLISASRIITNLGTAQQETFDGAFGPGNSSQIHLADFGDPRTPEIVTVAAIDGSAESLPTSSSIRIHGLDGTSLTHEEDAWIAWLLVANLDGFSDPELIAWEPARDAIVIFSTSDKGFNYVAPVAGATRAAAGRRYVSRAVFSNLSRTDVVVRALPPGDEDSVVGLQPLASSSLSMTAEGVGPLRLSSPRALAGRVSIRATDDDSCAATVKLRAWPDHLTALREYAVTVTQLEAEGRQRLGVLAATEDAVVQVSLYTVDGSLVATTTIHAGPSSFRHSPVADLFGREAEMDETLVLSVRKGSVFGYLSTSNYVNGCPSYVPFE